MSKKLLIFTFIVDISSMLFSSDNIVESYNVKSHEQWWEGSLNSTTSYEAFAGWLGDEQAPSRAAMRSHLKNKNYESILDIPCGLCIDYFGLKKDKIDVNYLGMDVTPKLINIAKENNIPVLLASIENIPISDSSIELVYSRHILEHLDNYAQALKELIRVSSKEVLVVFFLPPIEDDADNIDLSMNCGYSLYHNRYSKKQLEAYLKTFQKIKNWEWEAVAPSEEILHIYIQ